MWSKMNLHEKALCKVIKEAETYINDGTEIEINHQYNKDNPKFNGWYAMRYKENDGAYPLYANGYDRQPLISDETIERFNVDVYKCFKYCKVAYCG